MGDLAESLEQIDAEKVELRALLRKTQRQLADAKAKTADLVDAVLQGAREAALTYGAARVPARPARDRRTRSGEVAVPFATDWQVGKTTPTYNTDVAQDRLAVQFTEKVERLTALQREAHPVRHAVYLLGGDMVEGVQIFPGQAWSVDATLYDQLFAAANIAETILLHGLGLFDTIEVCEEIGNHGRLGKRGDYPATDNIDRIMYAIVRERFRHEPRLTWRALETPSIWNHFTIGNYSALLAHGDEIKSFGGNCVTPDVRVLTRDLRWVPAGDLAVGDRLLAFDEHGAPVRRYADAWVTATGVHERDVWRISFADGSFVRCTPEHPWIVSLTDRDRGGTGRQVWMTPPEIGHRLAHGGRKHDGAGVWMFQPVAPWDAPSRDYDSGFLAGAFDADGCLSKGPAHPRWPVASFTQLDNALLAAVKLALDGKGLAYKERTKHRGANPFGYVSQPIQNLDLVGRDDTLRFLGQMRPPRLLDWWMNRINVNDLTFTRKSTSGLKRIVDCRPDGRADICALSSSSATYITEHGPAHNTPAFGILRKVTKWRAGVAPAFLDCYMGHFHTPMVLVLPDGGRIFVSGSPESDNPYAQEFMAETGMPSQRINYVDPDRGRVTSEHVIYFDG